MNYIWIVH